MEHILQTKKKKEWHIKKTDHILGFAASIISCNNKLSKAVQPDLINGTFSGIIETYVALMTRFHIQPSNGGMLLRGAV